jgi:hypothetical protein
LPSERLTYASNVEPAVLQRSLGKDVIPVYPSPVIRRRG